MTLLLLGGTGIAQEIARDLARVGCPFVLSVAGGSRRMHDKTVPVRTGGFGGEQAFRRYLEAENISAVLDATHPFAEKISGRTAQICSELAMPYALAQRPEWSAQPGDRWTLIAREEDAASIIEKGSTVFLATGRQTLERFANLDGRDLICRQIEPPKEAFPFENGRYLVGRPPFSVDEERALFEELKVNWLVVKNAGGTASASKLVAARELGIQVAMIARPAVPDAPLFVTSDAALDWVNSL